MQTYKPLRIIAVLALIIAVMACASRRTASDELRSTATTTADAMATQVHAAVRTDTATAHTVSRDTTRQQTTTADTTGAHYRRATWQQAVPPDADFQFPPAPQRSGAEKSAERRPEKSYLPA